jgi:hypothetical protein
MNCLAKDILLYITSYMSPLDILILRRVSKKYSKLNVINRIKCLFEKIGFDNWHLLQEGGMLAGSAMLWVLTQPKWMPGDIDIWMFYYRGELSNWRLQDVECHYPKGKKFEIWSLETNNITNMIGVECDHDLADREQEVVRSFDMNILWMWFNGKTLFISKSNPILRNYPSTNYVQHICAATHNDTRGMKLRQEMRRRKYKDRGYNITTLCTPRSYMECDYQ